MSSFPSNSSEEIHPLDTFKPSMDYAHFEVDIINLYIYAARAHTNLLANSKLSLSFTPGRKSFSELCNFLINTNYNWSSRILCVPPCNFKPKMSVIIPFDHSFQPEGYFSPKHPDCLLWEGGIFEEGSMVFFGRDMRAGKVLGVCGVGKNYFMMGIKDLGRVSEGKLLIRMMVVSFPPTDFSILMVYCI
jgi:hypothetical protein